MTRYVVYLPPPIRTMPFVSTVTRCSREAFTVEPSDGARGALRLEGEWSLADAGTKVEAG